MRSGQFQWCAPALPWLLLLSATLVGCRDDGALPAANAAPCTDPAPTGPAISPQLARNFDVRAAPTGMDIVVRVPRATGQFVGPGEASELAAELQYHLTSCVDGPGTSPEQRVLPFRPARVATASTTAVAQLEVLDLLPFVVGHQGIAHVTSPTFHARVDEGAILELSDGANTDRERLLALGPDLFLSSPSGAGVVEEPSAQVPTLHLADFLEASPLARAEWLVFVGHLFGEQERAARRFQEIRNEYERLVALARSAGKRPKVLFSAPFSGVWHVPGGRSFAAQLIEDAGGQYLWRDLDHTGSVAMDIEAVWERAHQAEVWLQPFGWTSLEFGTGIDSRFAGLPVLESGQVYNNDRRTTPAGGNDYWELGAVRPDLVLADLLKILHPELLPEHELVFHRRLPRRQNDASP